MFFLAEWWGGEGRGNIGGAEKMQIFNFGKFGQKQQKQERQLNEDVWGKNSEYFNSVYRNFRAK
jgi:hypothetical protein